MAAPAIGRNERFASLIPDENKPCDREGCAQKASLICNRCFQTSYCSEMCRRNHWSDHKFHCSRIETNEVIRTLRDGSSKLQEKLQNEYARTKETTNHLERKKSDPILLDLQISINSTMLGIFRASKVFLEGRKAEVPEEEFRELDSLIDERETVIAHYQRLLSSTHRANPAPAPE